MLQKKKKVPSKKKYAIFKMRFMSIPKYLSFFLLYLYALIYYIIAKMFSLLQNVKYDNSKYFICN